MANKIRPDQIDWSQPITRRNTNVGVDHEAQRRKDLQIVNAVYDVERLVTARFMKAVPMGCNLAGVDVSKVIEGIGTTIEVRVKILVPSDFEPTTMEELESAVS